jgi:hypothetical protein
MVFNLPLHVLCIVTLAAVSMAFGLSPQRWREAHRNQYQVVYVVFMSGITAVLFATGGPMFLSIAFAAMTLFFSAVFVVDRYVKRSRASARAS